MRLLTSRLSLTCSGRLLCDTLHIPPISRTSGLSTTNRQLRVLLTASSTTSTVSRSPHQWSHIAHHIRKPSSFEASKAMGTDLKLNLPQARTHMGHSHDHHNHDNTYLTSSNKKDPGVRITRIGLYVNLGMAIAKGAGGYVFNSQALTADALHSATDLVSDITTLATISYSLRPATPRFPTGFGKIESLGALGVSGLLLSGGIMIGLQAIMVLCQQLFPEIAHMLSHLEIFGHGHSHSHGGEYLGPNVNAAWLAGGSIVIKEWLYRATIKVAKQKRSSVLASNAYHHRVDSLTAFVALLTISASHFLTNAQWLDPVGGLLISGMIVQAGWGNTKAALLELADVGMDEDIKEAVEMVAKSAVAKHVGQAAEIRGVQGVKSGQNFLVEIEVAAPKSWTLKSIHEVESVVRADIVAKVKGVRRVQMRFVADGKHDVAFADEFVAGRMSDGETEEHEHDHEGDSSQANGHATSVASQKQALKSRRVNGSLNRH